MFALTLLSGCLYGAPEDDPSVKFYSEVISNGKIINTAGYITTVKYNGSLYTCSTQYFYGFCEKTG